MSNSNSSRDATARASTAAALAAHRFGLGEATLAMVGSDPQRWLLEQIGPADAPWGHDLASLQQALADVADGRRRRQALQRERAQAASGAASMVMGGGDDMGSGAMAAAAGASAVMAGQDPAEARNPERLLVQRDLNSRMLTAVHTQRPFAERLHWFWCNHFTVSMAKGSARGLVGAFEREAIRPNIAGRFEDLLWASTTHTAMLRYLDNHLSIGPDSQAAKRRGAFIARQQQNDAANARTVPTGLNENLAREVLELHTLGAESARKGGYAQADVTALASVLTGWHGQTRNAGGRGARAGQLFEASWHQGGSKTLLGRRYPEGQEALRQVVRDLARHPDTARFIATKLARHFVANVPPPDLVLALERRFIETEGQLGEVYATLVRHPRAWSSELTKLKTPEEFVVSAVRSLRLAPQMESEREAQRLVAAVVSLGQRPQAAPSPAGWSDEFQDWMGPDAVWKRVELSVRLAQRLGRTVDARQTAPASMGALLSTQTAQQIERASDGEQALVLWLMSPEFQRR
jgi:uncharacterized protein (DUF1800 family)